MSGFRDFIARGNLVEMAVAFIMGSVFAPVVESFTKIVMDIIGVLIGTPDFSELTVGGVNIGVFITSVVTFLLTAMVVYFLVVKPYNAFQQRYHPAEDEAALTTSEELLAEIRDTLKANPRS